MEREDLRWPASDSGRRRYGRVGFERCVDSRINVRGAGKGGGVHAARRVESEADVSESEVGVRL